MVNRKTNIHNMLGSFLLLALLCLPSNTFANARTLEGSEAVCPDDFFLLQLNDGSNVNDSETAQRNLRNTNNKKLRPSRKLQTTTEVPPGIEITRQGGDTVEFVVTNTEAILGDGTTLVPDHVFVNYYTNIFRSETCPLFDDLAVGMSTTTQTAYCFDTPRDGKIALVKVYVRSLGKSSGSSATIPKCCHDPFQGVEARIIEYVFAVRCGATCDDPYFLMDDDATVTRFPTQVPTSEEPTDTNDVPDEDVGVTKTGYPTQVPTTEEPTDTNDVPLSEFPSLGETSRFPLSEFPSLGETSLFPSLGETSRFPLSEFPSLGDTSRNPGTSDPTTEQPTDTNDVSTSPTFLTNTEPPVTTSSPTQVPTEVADMAPPLQQCGGGTVSTVSRDLVVGSQREGPHYGSVHPWAWPNPNDNGCGRFKYVESTPNAVASPCNVASNFISNRNLEFESEYMNFQFQVDRGMEAVITLPSGETKGFWPAGASGSVCSAPPDGRWDDYPLRLVKSGRYYHHWYAEKVGCNGEDDSRLEIKVTPDCVELHIVSNQGAQNLNWMDATDSTSLASSTNGYVGISYCVTCDSEVTGSPFEELSGCSIVETPLPTDCCPLNPAGRRDDNLCGDGWTYDTCSASSLATTDMTSDVALATSAGYPVKADGHSFHVEVPRGSGNQLVNDDVEAIIQNRSGMNKKVKVNFHIQQPRFVTGVSGVLVDPTTNEPTGIHVQMSKNWHENRPVLYDSYWWTGIAHFRVPPGETKVKLVIAYQYYEGLHGVSHSQLSLLGWGTNGLWEEVGLGANGESMTYEPHGHHRRQMVLDNRPWLVCELGTSCNGSPDATRWTENVGGADFLNAIDNRGKYQYLVRDTAFHTMNGPRLTNATYNGVTVDEKIDVTRTVSTWTADDMARHLHSFEYTFKTETAGDYYPRFAMYTLGGDNYNYVQYPLFAYGSGGSNAFLGSEDTLPVRDIIQGIDNSAYTDYYSVDAPAGCSIAGSNSGSCWFAMLTDPSENVHQRAHRGIIVRNFRGRLNGQTWPSADDVSPFTFNLITSGGRNTAKNTVSLELGLPASFKAAVDAGQAKFMEGDFLAADIELFLPPRQSADYFGNSQRLLSWLSDAGVDADFAEGWKLIAREAAEGDAVVTTVFEGELERLYHPRIRVGCPSNEARFNVALPSTLPGILPITIAGVGGTEAGNSPKLWRYTSGSWSEFATTPGDYQLEQDVTDNTLTYVYSLSLESASPPASECEQFFFGAVAPTDENPPCA